MARIRPKIRPLLRRGVKGTLLRSSLAGLKVWYRLTELALRGDAVGALHAALNPEMDVETFRKLQALQAANRATREAQDKTKKAEGDKKETPDPLKLESGVPLVEQAFAFEEWVGGLPKSGKQGRVVHPQLEEAQSPRVKFGFKTDPAAPILSQENKMETYQDRAAFAREQGFGSDYLTASADVSEGRASNISAELLSEAVFDRVLRELDESMRSPLMRLVGRGEIRWAQQGKDEEEKKRRVQEIFRRGLMVQQKPVAASAQVHKILKLMDRKPGAPWPASLRRNWRRWRCCWSRTGRSFLPERARPRSGLVRGEW
ncbi:hypothetical protein NKH18_40860 [Streptomyces sp. M10(2022)]